MCSRGARERECLKGSASAVEEEWLDGVFVCEGESWKERSWFDTTECARQPELGAIFLPRSRPEHGPAGTTEREGFSFISFSLGFCACVSGVEALSVKVEIRVSCPCVGRPR